jgi:molybdate transport system permease protein
MTGINWPDYWPPIRLSLQVALIAGILCTLFGTYLARLLSRRSFRGKALLETGVMLPLVLPPTVVGFLLLVLLGRRSWLGRLIEWVFSAPIIFTWWAAVSAAVVVAFPLVYQTMKAGFASMDRDLEEAGRSIGANEWQVFRYITLPLALPSFITAFILSFARSLGEFGATLMIAGNIPRKTETVPTAIYIAVESGNYSMAWAWTVSIIVVSFLMMLAAGRFRT